MKLTEESTVTNKTEYAIGDFVKVYSIAKRCKTIVNDERSIIFWCREKLPVSCIGQIVGLQSILCGESLYIDDDCARRFVLKYQYLHWQVKFGYKNKPVLCLSEWMERTESTKRLPILHKRACRIGV